MTSDLFPNKKPRTQEEDVDESSQEDLPTNLDKSGWTVPFEKRKREIQKNRKKFKHFKFAQPKNLEPIESQDTEESLEATKPKASSRAQKSSFAQGNRTLSISDDETFETTKVSFFSSYHL